MLLMNLEIKNYQRFYGREIEKLSYTPKKKIQVILGKNGSGKALPLKTLVRVKNGWTPIGKLYVGDEVIGKDGKLTKILAKYPHSKINLKELVVAGMRSIKCCEDHQWGVYINDVYRVLPIKQMQGLLDSGNVLYIDNITPEDREDVEFTISPFDYGISVLKNKTNIDRKYLLGSLQQRKELLRGLLLHCERRDNFSGTHIRAVVKENLKDDFKELVYGLGGSIIDADGAFLLKLYDVSFYLHDASKEVYQPDLDRILIIKILDKGISDAVCISIDNDDKLFVIENYLVTHNSSLLKEVIPNADSLNKEYDKDGYRYATYSNNNSVFILGYNKNSNSHSFILDNIEQNKTGSVTLQRNLILEHFKMNKLLHELLLSTNTFTSMTAVERKTMFTEVITDIDYKDATLLYMRAKESLRDIKAFIKLTQSKLLKDAAILSTYTADTFTLLNKDKEIFKKLIEDSLLERIPLKQRPKPDYYRANITANIIIEYFRRATAGTDVTGELLKESETLIAIHRENISNFTKQLTELEKYTNVESNDIETIMEDNHAIHSKIKILLVNTKFNSLQTLTKFITDFNLNYYEFMEVATMLSGMDDTIIDYDIDTLIDTYSKEYELLAAKISTLDKEIFSQVVHSKNDDVTCPACNNIFKPNHDKELLVKLNKEFKININKQILLKEKLDNELTKKRAFLEKTELIKKLHIFITNFNSIKLTEFIKSKTINFTEFNNLVNDISNFNLMLPKEEELANLADKLFTNEKLITLNKELNRENLIRTLKRKEAITLARVDEVKSLNERLAIKRELLKEVELLNVTKVYSKELAVIYFNMLEYKKYVKSHIRNREIDMLVSFAKEELILLDNKLAEYETVNKQRAILESELLTYKKSYVAKEHLIKYLSPTTGVIGKYVTNNINNILDGVNHILKQIWSYEVKLLPITEDSILDYKFKVKVGSLSIIDDVKLGSSGIKNIIDLAFLIVAIQHLKMELPLIVDELLNTLDKLHRDRATLFLKELANGSEISQIFIVSHYVETFNGYSGMIADVNVLDSDGLELEMNDVNRALSIVKK